MRLWKSILELAWNFWMKLFFFSLGDGESKFLVSSAILWLYWVKVNFHWEGLSGQSRLSGQNKINENDNYLELNSSRTVRACTWFLLDTVAYLFYILNKSLCQELSHLSSTILHECWSASVPLKFPGNGYVFHGLWRWQGHGHSGSDPWTWAGLVPETPPLSECPNYPWLNSHYHLQGKKIVFILEA